MAKYNLGMLQRKYNVAVTIQPVDPSSSGHPRLEVKLDGDVVGHIERDPKVWKCYIEKSDYTAWDEFKTRMECLHWFVVTSQEHELKVS